MWLLLMLGCVDDTVTRFRLSGGVLRRPVLRRVTGRRCQAALRLRPPQRPAVRVW